MKNILNFKILLHVKVVANEIWKYPNWQIDR